MSKRDTRPRRAATLQAEEGTCATTGEGSMSGSVDANLNEQAISLLIALFKMLDKWDRELKPQ